MFHFIYSFCSYDLHSCETATSQDSTNNTTLPGVFYEMSQNAESYATKLYDSVQELLHPPNISTTEETLSNEEMMQVISEDEGEKGNNEIDCNNSGNLTIPKKDIKNHLEKILSYCNKYPNHLSADEASIY